MLSAVALFLAANVVQAQPIDPRAWSDKPFRSKPDGLIGSGKMSYVVTIDRKGVPIHCDVDISSGSSAVDNSTCYEITKRIKFHPALDAMGNGEYGIFRQGWNWLSSLDNLIPREPSIDLVVDLNRMPLPSMKIDVFEGDVVVDKGGAIESCLASPLQGFVPYPLHDPGKLKDAQKSLADITCKQLQSSWKPIAARDENGAPVRSIQRAIVAYELSQ